MQTYNPPVGQVRSGVLRMARYTLSDVFMPLETAKLRARAVTASALSHRTRDPDLAALLLQVAEGFAEEARKRERWLLGEKSVN